MTPDDKIWRTHKVRRIQSNFPGLTIEEVDMLKLAVRRMQQEFADMIGDNDPGDAAPAVAAWNDLTRHLETGA